MKVLDPGKVEYEDKFAVFKSKHEGNTYCFFSFSYREFDENPVQYLNFRGGV